MTDKILPFNDFLYLLQIEEYENKRYLKILPRFFFRRGFQKRQKLVYTSRAQTTLIISIGLTIFAGIMLTLLAGWVLALIIVIDFIPIWILLANILLDPVYSLIKLSFQRKAQNYFSKNFHGKVIAVAGSFGKTTTKNYIYELLRYNYKTQMTPGNINTPTGIASFVLSKLNSSTEVLIVEMDTYFIGEIKRSCQITPPDIAILTNIGDQHLERLKTKANLKKALLEVFKYAKPDAVKISGLHSNLSYALEVAKIFNIPKDIVNDTVKKLTKPDRRGNVINMHGFQTIDESYNISFTTAGEGLKNALSEAKKLHKKLLVITGGIPELGKENKMANEDYGKLLAEAKVDVVLLKTILHKEVFTSLKEEKVILADSMQNAWEIIKEKFETKKTLVLMQPELGDNYY